MKPEVAQKEFDRCINSRFDALSALCQAIHSNALDEEILEKARAFGAEHSATLAAEQECWAALKEKYRRHIDEKGVLVESCPTYGVTYSLDGTTYAREDNGKWGTVWVKLLRSGPVQVDRTRVPQAVIETEKEIEKEAADETV